MHSGSGSRTADIELRETTFSSKSRLLYGDGGAIFTNDDEQRTPLRGIVNHVVCMSIISPHHDGGVNSDWLHASRCSATGAPLDIDYNTATGRRT
jgi:hypothetical protein